MCIKGLLPSAPTAPIIAPQQPVKVYSNTTNPSAASTQTDLSPDGSGIAAQVRQRGRTSLKINRNQGSASGMSGLNIPQ